MIGCYSLCVRVEGLEPPSLAALDPKSSVSTNFTTPALGTAKVTNSFISPNIFENYFHIKKIIIVMRLPYLILVLIA